MPTAPPPTKSFGKYQLVRKLATGGMAEVWLAHQTGIEGFQRYLVIKRILPHLAEDRDFVTMFLNEAKISAKFSHPNIAQIFDLGQIDGNYFIAMEYIHGEDLGRVMRKAWSTGQWVSRPLAIRIVASACEALAYAHARTDDMGQPLNVVHRDISPQNILISYDGSVKLVDFGIAKASNHTSVTKSGALKGKFAYMSPEQAGGKPLDRRADIFSIGLVLYELLTGVRPLKRDTELATLQAALACAIQIPSKVADVAGDLDAVVMRALMVQPERRYGDARDFQLALEEFLVSQRWVAGSVQIAELMRTLFGDRAKQSPQQVANSPVTSTGSKPSGNGAKNGSAASGSGPGSGGSNSNPQSAPAGSTPAGARGGPLDSPGGQKPTDMSWDAPPGASRPAQKRRARPLLADEGTAPSAAAEGDWEAPPGVAGHGRRRAKEAPSRTSPESPVSSGGGTMSKEVASTPPPEKTSSLRRSSGSQRPLQPATREAPPVADEEGPSGMLDAPAEGRAGSRRSSLVFSKGPSHSRIGPSMPEAPPPTQPKQRALSTKGLQDFGPEPLTPEHSRAGPSPLKNKGVLAVAGLVAFAVLGLTYKIALVPLFARMSAHDLTPDAQPVYITAQSNLHGQVLAIHAEKSAAEPVSVLGDIPLSHASGAHLGDTIVIENKSLGARYEQLIEYGQPNELRVVRKEFRTGLVMPNLRNAPPRGLSFFLRSGQKAAEYTPHLSFELVEGDYELTVRGPALAGPVPFRVRVMAGRTVTMVPLDIGPFLRRSASAQ